MAKWRDVKQNRVLQEKSLDSNIRSPKSDLASLGLRLKAFLTDTFLITTPILYIVIYLVMGSGEEFAQNRSLGWGIIFAIHSGVILIFWLKNGQTPGLKAYDIKLVDTRTKGRVSVIQVLIRYISTLFAVVSVFLLFLPFLIKTKKHSKIYFQELLSSTISNVIFNLSAFYFFYFAAVGVYIIFLPKVLHDIGYSAFDIGIIFALAPLMRFITPFLFLKHIKLDQKMFKSALFLSFFSSALFYLTIENFFLFLINNALLGVCLSLILPYLEVTAISSLGKEKYGKSRLYGSIGFMFIALVLAKFLTQAYIAIHYYLILNILTIVFALFLLRFDVQHEKIEEKESFSFLKYWPFWMSLFFMQMSFGGFYNFFTIYETAHGISLEMTSYLWSFGVICEILMLYFQAPLLKNNLLNIIKICVAITTFRWVLLYLYPDSLNITFFTQSLHAFSFGLYHSSVIIYLYTLYENKKLAQQFMYGVAYGLGGFIGALIAGASYGEYLFLYSAIFSFISFGTLYFVKNHKLITV